MANSKTMSQVPERPLWRNRAGGGASPGPALRQAGKSKRPRSAALTSAGVAIDLLAPLYGSVLAVLVHFVLRGFGREVVSSNEGQRDSFETTAVLCEIAREGYNNHLHFIQMLNSGLVSKSKYQVEESLAVSFKDPGIILLLLVGNPHPHMYDCSKSAF